MKKFLLIAASAMLALTTNAQGLTGPTVVKNSTFTTMSPNGKWAAGDNPFYEGLLEIINLETGEFIQLIPEAENESYSIGAGANTISDNGIFVISTTYEGTAAYYENGEIKLLPIPEGVTMAFANAITPDGSRITGTIGVGMTLEDETMQHPVIWNRQADGSYSEAVILPYPKKDATGRKPQYVQTIGISEDGKTLVGQMTDNSGWLSQIPYVFKEDADGNWTYQALGEEFINPLGIEFPEEVSEPKATDYLTEEGLAAYEEALAVADSLVQPEPTDFMTEENGAAYKAALEAYWETFINYPYLEDYMTDEELEAYNEAINYYDENKYPSAFSYMTEEAQEAYNIAEEAYFGFLDLVNKLSDGQAVKFDMNSIRMSLNGKYAAVAAKCVEFVTIDTPWGEYEDWIEISKVYVFDIETGEVFAKDAPEGYRSAYPVYIANDGRLLAAQPMDNWSNTPGAAFFASSVNDPLIPLIDVVKNSNQELYAWMEKNMFHKSIQYDYIWNEETEEEEVVENEVEMWAVGVPCCNADMSIIGTWVLNTWDYESDEFMYSYLMPIEAGTLGIEDVRKDEAKHREAIKHNLAGQRVGKDYKGLIISDGKIKIMK